MSNSKYEITDIAHKTYPFLHRIRALQDIGDWAKAGDLGGFVESESNLAVDPDDAAWIFNDAIACGSAYVDQDSILMNATEPMCPMAPLCMVPPAWKMTHI